MGISFSKNYVDIPLPTESADGYYMNKNKDKVAEFIYIDQEWYKQLLDPNTFYILGPKGSGKTLYAAYMCADVRDNTISKSHTIDVSDYGKLISMKTGNHLNFTEYLTMWKVILLQKFLFGLESREISFIGRSKNFKEIQNTISTFFGYDVSDDSFNPVSVIDSYGKQIEVSNFLRNEAGASLKSPVSNATFQTSGEDGRKTTNTANSQSERTSSQYTDTWLRSIDAFRKTIEQISFKYNHYLFVDGLDVRPKEIDATEYGECISALVRAVYDINTKILGKMQRKDSCDFKIIALTRTDIFLNSNLVNDTSCINDNCVELDWTYGNESDFPFSKLYKMMNRLLGWDGKNTLMPIDAYFGFQLPFPKKRPLRASMYIQRRTRLRPRDVVVLLRLIQKECVKRGLSNPSKVIFESPSFFSEYANYYTDQVKSEMMFKYSPDEIKSIFELVKMIDVDPFSEKYFESLFSKYCNANPHLKTLFPEHRSLLNDLYTLDLIGWRERVGKKQIVNTHWHYREVKAIDEANRLPWEQFDTASNPLLIVHKGASRHVMGYTKK